MSKHLSPHDYQQKTDNARVYDVAIVSPLQHAKNLSQRLGNTVLFKREDSQEVHSFKLRGAYNKIAHLSPAQRKKGVICASAGNHAQGVALSAAKLGIRAVIVMPVTTPAVKVDAVKGFGAEYVEVVLFGESYSDAYAHAQVLEKKHGLTFVHPFDDADVIAGQGTVAMEILKQMPLMNLGKLDAVFVAIGGGGLISGVANYIKAVNPKIKVIGVQMNDSNAMIQSVKANKRVTLPDVGLFSDGTAVKLVGAETFRIANSGLVDSYIEVDTDAVCAAIKDVFTDTRSIVEPAGALAVAAIKQYVAKHKCKGKTFAAILCGANMNFDRLRFVAERAEVGEEREALFAVTIPEERGSFKRFCALLGSLPAGGLLPLSHINTTNKIAPQAINTPPKGQKNIQNTPTQRNITEFTYRISDEAQAHVFVGLTTTAKGESVNIAKTLTKQGFKAIDLTHDDLARDHIRHMVGGHSQLAKDERLLRFEFPERPGALMKFLSAMRPGWNISLFHYRNQGADYGRILVGLQVPAKDDKAFTTFLKSLGYPYVEETNNPVYKLFLKS
ncbi:MAG TPA: threonine ammonia-lyase, biosynthetic [Burkholderiaceae bacterium]|mgnify:CR=1 FL=1|nr:threonine ammonia-lyase, biosynthetic [Burkholderiaceae bacterium]